MRRIEGYTDIELIGQGGLGDVYRARRTTTGATVAVKVLRDIADESVAWHRTRRELTALVSLTGHAHVVQLHEVLDLPGGPALVMEYAPGGSIADLMLRRDEPLSVGETVLVGRQIALALAAAHRRGIVHRDVKPQNLLVDAYGQVKLCDFGIAAMARSPEFRDRTTAISMRYASPEDLDEEPDVGPPADVYSLGATMLHMARGAPPTLKERLAPWEPPAAAAPEMSALDRITAACLHPMPDRRPAAADLADDLERLGWSIDERNQASRSRVEAIAAPNAVTGATGATDRTVRPHPGRTSGDGVRAPAWRRWLPVTAVLLGLAGCATVGRSQLVAGPAGDSTGADDVRVVARPAGLAPLTELDWPSGPVGECLAQRGTSLSASPCSEPHDLQRVVSGVIDDRALPTNASFDATELRASVRDTCDGATHRLDATARGLAVPITLPSLAAWLAGDRRYECFVAAGDARLIGDLIGHLAATVD